MVYVNQVKHMDSFGHTSQLSVVSGILWVVSGILLQIVFGTLTVVY